MLRKIIFRMELSQNDPESKTVSLSHFFNGGRYVLLQHDEASPEKKIPFATWAQHFHASPQTIRTFAAKNCVTEFTGSILFLYVLLFVIVHPYLHTLGLVLSKQWVCVCAIRTLFIICGIVYFGRYHCLNIQSHI